MQALVQAKFLEVTRGAWSHGGFVLIQTSWHGTGSEASAGRGWRNYFLSEAVVVRSCPSLPLPDHSSTLVTARDHVHPRVNQIGSQMWPDFLAGSLCHSRNTLQSVTQDGRLRVFSRISSLGASEPDLCHSRAGTCLQQLRVHT